MSVRRRTSLLVLLLAAAAALAGCSQIAALAPVGGDRPTEIRYATIDVLLAEKVDILTAPTCQMAADRAVTCSGETADGEAIEASSTAQAQERLVVRVGDTVLFDGEYWDILNKAARGEE